MNVTSWSSAVTAVALSTRSPAAKPGPVYRLRECSIKDGIALAGDVQGIAADFRTFPQRLEIAVERISVPVTGRLLRLHPGCWGIPFQEKSGQRDAVSRAVARGKPVATSVVIPR